MNYKQQQESNYDFLNTNYDFSNTISKFNYDFLNTNYTIYDFYLLKSFLILIFAQNTDNYGNSKQRPYPKLYYDYCKI